MDQVLRGTYRETIGVSASMDDSKLETLRDLKKFAPKFLIIKSKSGAPTPFTLNRAQQYIDQRLEKQREATGKIRAVILKGRQQGCSTYIQARYFHKVVTSRGKKAFILTHDKEATKNLFTMANRFYDNLESGLVPVPDTANAKELYFRQFDSGYSVGTAGNKSVGRSQTIQLFHGCLSADSLIVLSDGSTVRMDEIKIGDLVVTSSGATAPVMNKIYTGEKLTYELSCWNSGEPIYLTADHKVLTLNGYKQASSLTAHDYIAMPKITASNAIKTVSYKLKNKERPQCGGTKHIEEYEFNLTYDFGYFAGYYLAEGHIKKNKGYITFTYHKDEKYIDKALSGISNLATSIKHKVDDNSNRARTHINGKFLASSIESFFGRVSGKRIPEWVFRSNKEFLCGILNGYLDGDGSKTQKDSITAPSIHEKISRQIQRIVWSLYGACSINKFCRKRYDTPTKDIYLLRLCGNSLAKYVGLEENQRKEKSIFINGTVYCKVKKILPRIIEPVWDIEIDHPDHNYQTTTGVVSNSEVAFWAFAEDHAKGILQAISSEPGTEVILESTANGIGNYFHQRWVAATSGTSEYQAIFVPWYWQPEYTHDAEGFVPNEEEEYLLKLYQHDGLTHQHLSWRRIKIGDLSKDYDAGLEQFKQEYPFSANEAFLNPIQNVFINAKHVITARKNNVEGIGPLIIGVDVAIGDHDRTAIIRRRGRSLFNLEKFGNHNTMEICGRLKRIITEEKPVRVYIDCIGIGAGVVDRMQEMGYDCVEGVNVARSANEKEKFRNLRAELWSEMRDWLTQEMPVQIVDDDEFHGELCCLGFKFTSSGQLQIESKDDLRARGMPSPDGADAAALTFFSGLGGGFQQFPVDKRWPGEERMFS